MEQSRKELTASSTKKGAQLLNSSATTAAYTASAFTDKALAQEEPKPGKRTTTTTTVVTKQKITMEEIAQVQAGSFEELRIEEKEGSAGSSKVLTKSSKSFKQNPAKFKLSSGEESKRGSNEGLLPDEGLRAIPEVDQDQSFGLNTSSAMKVEDLVEMTHEERKQSGVSRTETQTKAVMQTESSAKKADGFRVDISPPPERANPVQAPKEESKDGSRSPPSSQFESPSNASTANFGAAKAEGEAAGI